MANSEGRFSSVGVLDYMVSMAVFLVIIGGLAYADIINEEGVLVQAFAYNWALNSSIVGVLGLGILYSFGQVMSVGWASRWIRSSWRFGHADQPGLMVSNPGGAPRLMSAVGALFSERPGPIVFDTFEYRSILDSVGTRLDESREITRYMIGLLIFLGLLGTFWGLLKTVSSVGGTIDALSQAGQASEAVFAQFLDDLREPINGMGTAFSSSLLGLAGSLVLGFLDLRAGQAQNRFYNHFEEYLSRASELGAPRPGGLDDY